MFLYSYTHVLYSYTAYHHKLQHTNLHVCGYKFYFMI